jgi:DNA-directed RNA polymerase subunit RPC12/RpoP
MSEFKFACSNCGQHLSGEEDWVGRRVRCPACRTELVVPHIPAAVAVNASFPASPPPLPSIPVTSARAAAPSRPTNPNLWRLAAASLTLSLLTLPLSFLGKLWYVPFGLLGCLPGVICGHLALTRIQAAGILRGRNLAIAGLVAGYFFLGTITIGSLVYRAAQPMLQQFAANTAAQPPPELQPRRELQAPPESSPPTTAPPLRPPARVAPPVQRSPSPPVVAPNLPAFPRQALPQTQPRMSTPVPLQPLPRDLPVPTDPRTIGIPVSTAAGRLGGQSFQVTKAALQGGVLTLSQGDGFVPDFQVTVFLFTTGLQDLGGTTWLVPNPTAPSPTPHVHLRWREGTTSKTETLSEGYAMRIEFGRTSGQTLPGKIYLELPQRYRTKISGAFTAKLL